MSEVSQPIWAMFYLGLLQTFIGFWVKYKDKTLLKHIQHLNEMLALSQSKFAEMDTNYRKVVESRNALARECERLKGVSVLPVVSTENHN